MFPLLPPIIDEFCNCLMTFGEVNLLTILINRELDTPVKVFTISTI